MFLKKKMHFFAGSSNPLAKKEKSAQKVPKEEKSAQTNLPLA